MISTEDDIYHIVQPEVQAPIGQFSPLGVLSLQTEQVEVIFVANQRVFGDRIKGIDNVLPHRFSTNTIV